MHNYLHQDIPLVVICNYLEVFEPLLDRIGEPDLFEKRGHAARDLFWLGDRKLVITAYPSRDAEALTRLWGYPNTEIVQPSRVTTNLCVDIAQDLALIDRLAGYADPAGRIQLIPYAATQQFLGLADLLQERYGLQVFLPETPSREYRWVRDYTDSKIGFRSLVAQWQTGNTQLPFGIICSTVKQAVDAVQWFGNQGLHCIAKTNDGGGGYGNLIFTPDQAVEPAHIERRILEQLTPSDTLMVIEEFIFTPQQLFPSLEFFIPALGAGQPEITYLSNQVFGSHQEFDGVLVSRELMQTDWYPKFKASGEAIAYNLQRLGYVGHFDLDAIVDDRGKIYLLEVNSRRTGGTHVHEFACFAIGNDYQDRVSLLSNNSLSSGGAQTLDELAGQLNGLLYPAGPEPYGVVITQTATLDLGAFGAIFIAASYPELLELKRMTMERLMRVRPPAAAV